MSDRLKQINAGSIEAFLKSPEWEYFNSQVEERLEGLRRELETGITLVRKEDENIPLVIPYEGLTKRQGSCEELRWISTMPTILQEVLANEEKKQKEEDE